ncbi:MAG TPA: sigma-70 region 4 domain-containing protein, partial [Solirubrobacteraceae bacterium]|nr:sigma-70 region 4 domain-containing protein [Solirubrobacteraceae bacterium]
MTRLDDLPPDQRAALSLLLSQGKTYAEVAELLGIGERAVHDRAHAALAMLAPREARELTPERREEIGDYLLAQSAGLAERLRTRSLLDDSPAAQAWAAAVADELEPLASGPLPEIPDHGAAPAPAPDGPPPPPRAPLDAAHPGGSDPPSRPSGGRATQLPSSRVGGAILLAVIAAVVVVVVLLASGGSAHNHARANGASASATSATSSGSSTTPRASETKRLTLTPPDPASKSLGVAAVLQEGSTYAFYLAAERLPPSHGFFYAVWLYNSPSSFEALSKSPPVGSNGRLQGGSLLPANAANYHQMIVTRETSERPTTPGPIVL